MTKDKYSHFIICFVISLYSTEAALAASIVKEWCDTSVYGANTKSESRKDFLADILGIALGTTIRALTIGRWNWF